MKKGYVQIYTGDGKGKTTAALGLALRAAGHGLKVFIGQFMKGQHYGELTSLKGMPSITIEQFGSPDCITRDQVTISHKEQGRKGLQRIKQIMVSREYDIIILDEVCVAIWFGVVSEDAVIDIIQAKPKQMEMVLTGRKASERLLATADLITRMAEVKHYYSTMGVSARTGIEN